MMTAIDFDMSRPHKTTRLCISLGLSNGNANMADETVAQSNFTTMTTELVAAYVARNSVPVAELPNLIRSVHQSLSGLGSTPVIEEPVGLKPAVSIKKSITEDYLISLEDGRKFKSLKRYLMSSHNMTPADYRAKWGLPKDYPMVAPAYAKARSELARSTGLGRKAAEEVAPEPEPEVVEAAPAEAPKKRGRAKKTA